MVGNTVRFGTLLFLACLLDATLGCRSKLRPTISLTCSPIKDTLRYLEHKLGESRQVDISPNQYMQLLLALPLSNGNLTIDNLANVTTIIDIPVRLRTVHLLYWFYILGMHGVSESSTYLQLTNVPLRMQLWIKKDNFPWQVSFKIEANCTNCDVNEIPRSREAAHAALQCAVKKIVESDVRDLEHDGFQNCTF